MKTEGREVNPDQVTPHVVHPGLHQDYNLDFRMRRVDDIAPTLTSPMLSGLVSSVRLAGRPEVPKRPASPKMEEGLWARGGAPAGPDVPGPSHIGGPMETEGTNHWSRRELISTQPFLHLTQRTQLPSSYQMMTRLASLLVGLRPSLHQKLSWPGARSDPWRTGVHAHLLQRSGLQKKRRRVHLLVKQFSPKRYGIFTLDYNWVQSVRGSLLGLEAGALPSRRDIDNSSCFVPRAAASKSDLPEVITEHWLPIPRREGLLMECPPDQFTAPADWVPLYTHEGLQKYQPAAL